jgi:hypothetical protein
MPFDTAEDAWGPPPGGKASSLNHVFVMPINSQDAERVRLHMSAMSRIEQLWMDGAQRDAWDEYKALFQKKYSNPQDEASHHDAFQRSAKEIIAVKRACAATGERSYAGFTPFSDRPDGAGHCCH